jgi:predicted RNA-binding protein with PUA-like domain
MGLAHQESGDCVMAHWLFKSEPDVFSFDMLVAKGKGGEEWSGVRNYQARNNMRAMKIGELGLYYHSNIGKAAVGIVEVCNLIHPDSTAEEPAWECVDIRAVAPFKRAVGLDEIKEHPKLGNMVLVKNSRLSVQPVTTNEFKIICKLGGVEA